ncbi:GNAT family N-acetyltransferase [Kitasatospora sp. GP82]|uniref:GNAT family N-acetyltransferase n=1 Tax=Kitasatospora sp. GP82 TaxID=3035089 RepID=UPI002474488A|nr:GNAT family N-acetyltransferase [Kitasatospora sp. GP82]MDH6129827.1 putative GNAT family acetyltransferase [Kitasatospora sp. GP82]
MTWTLSTSLDDFRVVAGDFLAAQPALNTVPLTIVDRLAKDGPHAFGEGQPRFGWWQEEPQRPVSGVFVQTPPFGVVLGAMSGEAPSRLAEVLATAAAVAVPSVQGNKQLAAVFARAWERTTGRRAEVQVHERLYHLWALAQPDPAPSGSARLAVKADHALLVAWHEAFSAESAAARPGVDHNALVGRRIAEGLLHVWEDDGRPVSFAGVSPVIAGMSRIGPVYTPPELRRRGYASGIVAAGSEHALAQGATEVLLYTDLANRTSNSIYQQLGYVMVHDALVLDLELATG